MDFSKYFVFQGRVVFNNGDRVGEIVIKQFQGKLTVCGCIIYLGLGEE